MLDLGYGTSLFLARLLGERRLVGVDPTAAMPDIARRQPGGDQVTWINEDARTLEINCQFDLIVLTGQAVQVFLNDDDKQAVAFTIAKHLAPKGRLIFDSRNPIYEEWRSWTPTAANYVLRHPRFGEVES